MDKIEFFTDEIDGSEHVIIDKGNGEFVGMSRAVYDEQQAAQEAQSFNA